MTAYSRWPLGSSFLSLDSVKFLVSEKKKFIFSYVSFRSYKKTICYGGSNLAFQIHTKIDIWYKRPFKEHTTQDCYHKWFSNFRSELFFKYFSKNLSRICKMSTIVGQIEHTTQNLWWWTLIFNKTFQIRMLSNIVPRIE